MAQVVDMMRAHVGSPIKFAMIGLGVGTLACRAQSGDTLHIYELDPDIIRIARDHKLFTFLSECAPDAEITSGDARLTLADAPDQSYDIIFVDAFISDAIPIHLITREAMALYLDKLKPHGVVVIHASNRYIELPSVIAGIAEVNGAITRVNDGADSEADENEHKYVAAVAAVARSDEDFGALAKSDFWPILNRDKEQRVWTDDYSNVFGAVLRKQRE